MTLSLSLSLSRETILMTEKFEEKIWKTMALMAKEDEDEKAERSSWSS